jgi:hypothetical protein
MSIRHELSLKHSGSVKACPWAKRSIPSQAARQPASQATSYCGPWVHDAWYPSLPCYGDVVWAPVLAGLLWKPITSQCNECALCERVSTGVSESLLIVVHCILCELSLSVLTVVSACGNLMRNLCTINLLPQ